MSLREWQAGERGGKECTGKEGGRLRREWEIAVVYGRSSR